MEDDEIRSELEMLHSASYAWSLTCCGGDSAEACDVLQTAYLKVLDGRARFAGRSSLKTWFFSVLRRTAGERRRRRWVRRTLLARWHDAREATADRSLDPHRSAAARESSLEIRGALDELSERQRLVLDLVFYQDLSVREAAEVLGMTLGTARSHYARGKKKLLAALEGLR